MASLKFEKSEELLRYFVKLSEEHGAEVSTLLPYGEKWIILTVEVCHLKPDLGANPERDEARRLAAGYFASWWSELDGPAQEQRLWDEQMAATPWMREYLTKQDG